LIHGHRGQTDRRKDGSQHRLMTPAPSVAGSIIMRICDASRGRGTDGRSTPHWHADRVWYHRVAGLYRLLL